MTGRSYEHRRSWVEERLRFLSEIFAIDICAYAVMHNHTHTVLQVNQSEALNLSDLEVLERWEKLHTITLLAKNYRSEKSYPSNQFEANALKATIAVYRKRLFDLSWFMRELNEFIAKKANREDDCTGHFWEGRFKSQALLDEQALLACMAYVDLNPVRANLATSPLMSDFTSIQKRLVCHNAGERQPSFLAEFCSSPYLSDVSSRPLPFVLKDYLALIEFSCSNCLNSKQNTTQSSDILASLSIEILDWFSLMSEFESVFSTFAGTLESLDRFKACNLKQRRPKAKIRI